jgi:hypothetical protein
MITDLSAQVLRVFCPVLLDRDCKIRADRPFGFYCKGFLQAVNTP